jgi:hypothetical protein
LPCIGGGPPACFSSEASSVGCRSIAYVSALELPIEAVEELGLTEGASVTAVIKASDVMIATED